MDLEVYQSNKGSNSVYIFYLSEIKLAKLRPKLKKITSVAPWSFLFDKVIYSLLQHRIFRCVR